ncbi:creatininase family protein [Microlunatus soli]|uniref:Creatinine amidohydrolase n=1 Tax=Microlunatus soli TaxID=630515 RepID=A0A1H1ZKS3_9ACTN|nr:creatininase family protein [Microlunatus soli]SDT34177.1 creatinine amidohydrolase [Microlunatus soli]
MTVRHLAQLTRGQARAAAAGGGIAVLPIGSIEQHADHLPLGTDFLLVDAVLDRALTRLESDSTEWLRLPTLTYGHSPHHLFAAAVTLQPATVAAVLADILASLSATGFRRMIIVNGHGGNDELIRLAVKTHALQQQGSAAACSYWTLTDDSSADQADQEVERVERTPGHAGWFETSLMMAAHPDLVAEDRPYAPADPPPLFDRSPHPTLTVERHGEWSRVGGITDDPNDADAATGTILLKRRVQGMCAALRAFDFTTR